MVRYRGLEKNTAQLTTLFVLSNLWMARGARQLGSPLGMSLVARHSLKACGSKFHNSAGLTYGADIGAPLLFEEVDEQVSTTQC
jgi:hypothetical protein